MIDRRELAEMLPGVGPDAVAARYCPVDGHADPLALRQALLKALVARPGIEVLRARVDAVRPLLGGGFEAWAGGERRRGQRVVLTAGLNAPALADGLGLSAPVRPQRGQILVTERLPRFLDMACHNVRQTADGTVMLGDSKEDVGFDDGVTATAAQAIVQRAARTFPALRRARVVRQWGALRVMTPDGLPLYAQSRAHPGAALLTCHSGVTLAAAHAGEVAKALLSDTLEERYPAFTAARFGVAA
jgi:glycine/D-amino acid oxidase-like deaminating enzyme